MPSIELNEEQKKQIYSLVGYSEAIAIVEPPKEAAYFFIFMYKC